MDQEISCPHFIQEQHVSKSLQGKSLYKDQCTKCFDDPSKTYIDLCLKCYNGGCSSHSQEHFKQFGHSIVLEIKIRPDEEKIQAYKEEVEKNKGQEITKLAIGKTGGFQDIQSNEFKKTIMQLKCLECKVSIPNEKLEGVIQSIEQTDSAFRKQDLVQWENEIFPCEHTLTLQQLPVKVKDMSEATCSQCDLSKNLWMCLTCGELGCGRKQPDGSGGNNHGIQHGEQTGHPLVVKMGTISPNGEASLYCYSCNNDVKDDQLPEHLAHLGLSINSQKKTEKTLAEMNLDLNLNVALSSIVEEGKKLDLLFGANFTGLVNLGNSCYINSVLQVLFHFEEFQKRYYQEGQKHLNSCDKIPSQCYYCQFSKLGNGLISGQYSSKLEVKLPDGREKDLPEQEKYYQEGIKINDLKQMIAKNHQEFSSSRMQDAMEYYQHVLQFVKKNEKQHKLKDITKIFQFTQTTRLECLKCHGVKYNEVETSEFKLPVRKPNQEELQKILNEKQQRQVEIQKAMEQNKPIQVSLEDPEYETNFQECVDLHMQGDAVEVFCPQCQQNTHFKSMTYCKTLPDYLVIPVQRFVLENWVPQKLNAMIQVPATYKFDKFLFKKQENEKLLQAEEPKKGPQVDENALNQLLQMGMNINRCKRALLANQNNVELATNWIFETMEDPSLDEPIQEENPDKKQKFTQENVEMVMNMGFTEKAAKIGLSECDNDIERAVDYLFNHPNVEQQELQQEEAQEEDKQQEESIESLLNRSEYELCSVIIHLGNRSDSGHYICYIKINNKWVLFNDTKVAESDKPVLEKGYLYFFRRK